MLLQLGKQIGIFDKRCEDNWKPKMVPGTATPSPSQRHHKTFWNANSWKPEVCDVLGRFCGPWLSLCGIIQHEQWEQKVSVMSSTAFEASLIAEFYFCLLICCLKLPTEILQWPGLHKQAYRFQRFLSWVYAHRSLIMITFFCCHSFRALVNIIKANSYLIDIDPILLRSCLYLIPLDELLECNLKVNIELLDMLQVFLHKAPDDISFDTVQVCTIKQSWCF